MLLAIDVGNTHTVLGLFDGSQLRRHWRILTEQGRTADEYSVVLWNLLRMATIDPVGDRRRDRRERRAADAGGGRRDVRHTFGRSPLVVGPGTRTGMAILYDNPREVGADRIVNSVAAYERHHDLSIVVDFGTATTFDVVSARGEYLGGVIAPGVGISLEALYARTAKLHPVELVKPPRVVGRNTVNAIQSGSSTATCDGRRGGRAHPARAGRRRKVIATGGFAGMIAAESRTITRGRRVLDARRPTGSSSSATGRGRPRGSTARRRRGRPAWPLTIPARSTTSS
jgi:type III pantothenate kinase